MFAHRFLPLKRPLACPEGVLLMYRNSEGDGSLRRLLQSNYIRENVCYPAAAKRPLLAECELSQYRVAISATSPAMTMANAALPAPHAAP
jgi:hypothetical protein